jgi:hypothetical protein
LKKLALLVVPALLLQVFATTQFDTSQLALKRAFLLASYVILIAGAVGLRGRVTRALALVGILLNAIPIAANGGLMPTTQGAVFEATGERPALHSSRLGSKDIVLPRDEIRLYALTDRIVVERIHNVVSIGDIVLLSALISYIGAGIIGLFRRPPPVSHPAVAPPA